MVSGHGSKKIGGKLSDYEKVRLEKIKRNKALLDSLFPDLADTKQKLRSTPVTLPRKERRRRLSSPYPEKGPVVVRRNPGRKARTSLTPSHCPPGAQVHQKSAVYTSLDDDFLDRYERKIRIYRDYSTQPTKIDLDLEEETEEERALRIARLMKPARHVNDKKYDSYDGRTCHQCRQKTLDGKTKCNNKNCVGVRGQFCGVCLFNRYGEDAETAIADKSWVCPPCKGFCNCSVCLSKKGRRPTGVLYPQARDRGFGSVKDYLASLKKDQSDEDEVAEEEEEEEGQKEGSSETMELTASQEQPSSDVELSSLPPSSQQTVLSEMEYDEENKENIDPNLGKREEDKENIADVVTSSNSGVTSSSRYVLREPLVVLKDSRSSYLEDMEGEVDKIRRSTEKLNISNEENQNGDEKMLISPNNPSKMRSRKSGGRVVIRCLITWQSSRYAGGHQWVAPDRIPILSTSGKVPKMGSTVEVKWGRAGKLHPATLSKVQYGLRRRKSCKF